MGSTMAAIGTTERGSTAADRKAIGAPVLMVFDISGFSAECRVLFLGTPLRSCRRDSWRCTPIRWSEGHARDARAQLSAQLRCDAGWLPRDMQLQIPGGTWDWFRAESRSIADALIAQMAVAVSARFDGWDCGGCQGCCEWHSADGITRAHSERAAHYQPAQARSPSLAGCRRNRQP